MGMSDPFGLKRFTTAQENVYERVLAELKAGQKRSHWMWYIFPQVKGLGRSLTSQPVVADGSPATTVGVFRKRNSAQPAPPDAHDQVMPEFGQLEPDARPARHGEPG